ncbi:MAG: glycerate kinase [Chloroflexota bacterium]|nr:glycerate kinase [Chloroflexota bacterium]
MNEHEQFDRGYAICQSLYRAAIRAVDPHAATLRALGRDGETLTVGGATFDLARVRKIVVIGFGKAAVPMAQAVEAVLGDRVTRGIVVTKYGQREPTTTIAVREAGHPTPDAAGIEATTAMLDELRDLTHDDLVICLVSGGGSALFEKPVDGLTLEDMQHTTRQLIRAGAPITALNAVRKHLSTVKGGQLARRAAPATLIALMVSDVVGDPLDVTASGPTVPDPTTFADALAALDTYGVRATVPAAVVAYLEAGMHGAYPETPKAGDPCFAATHTLIIANAQMALDAAAHAAEAMGLPTLVLASTLEGEAREVARMWASIARQVRDHAQPIAPPCCLLAGGETTVTVTGDGEGGRNSEFALAAALVLDGTDGIVIASLATDGGDGTTDAAGAVVSGATIAQARAAGLDAADFCRRNDAYTFFDQVGGLIRPGPTGTNVNDLMIALIK